MEMHQQLFTLPSRHDSLTLSVLAISPEEPRAVVQLAHGMCEHKERYLPFMRCLAEHGYACVINDHRGHGASVKDPEDLGYFYDGGAEALIDDMRLVAEEIGRRYPDLPIALFGHSMGSLAVRAYTKRYDRDIKALVVCGSPSASAFAGTLQALDGLLIRAKGGHSRSDVVDAVFGAALESRFRHEGVANSWICSDRAVVDAYNADPLCGFTFTLNGYRALLALLADAYSADGWHCKNPGLPIRFLSGANDPCMVSRAAFGKAVEAMRNMGYVNVTSRLFEGMRHEILNETGHQAVYEDILALLDECL